MIAHSDGAGWRSIYAACLVEAPLDVAETAVSHPSMIYHIGRPTEVTRKIPGAAAEKALIGPRRICLTPAKTMARWQHFGRPEILQVYVRQSVYEAVAGEMFGGDPARMALRPRFAMQDPLLEQLLIAVVTELRNGAAGGGLYIDTIAHVMAARLARAHSAQAALRAPTRSGMPGWRIRRLADYIEANLDADLDLETMAAEVGLSPLYLVRAFKAEFGETPHQYVLKRRIERAKELLRDTEMSIVEISLCTGFSSQSHLSNWFQRLVGVSPGAYRRQS